MIKKRYKAFDRLLTQARLSEKRKFLIFWNRGLGDIPLGLYAATIRIRHFIPEASITFYTRKDLAPCFEMLPRVESFVDTDLKRGETSLNLLDQIPYDELILSLNPTRDVAWQIKNLIPKLHWQEKWDCLASSFRLHKECIGLHISSETEGYYGYTKDWPLNNFKKLIREKREHTFLLFGINSKEKIEEKNVMDLRGKTSLFEMIALIKTYCKTLVAPDSGILSILYYIDATFPLRLISLWADPCQGVLRQQVPSPNPSLCHIPLVGKKNLVENISISEVAKYLK
ncbi:MAG: glycosyltransferase family 9 protein [Simkaniaceae bacterium]